MLTQLFKAILATSVSAIPIILLLVLLAPLLRRHFTPQLRYLLWLVIALRMVIPTPATETPRIVIPAGNAVFYLEDDTDAVANAFAEAELLRDDVSGLSTTGNTRAVSRLGLLAMIWVAGAALLVLGQAAACLRTNRWLKRWSSPASEDAIHLADACRRELGIDAMIGVRQCGVIATPLLTGLIRPRILLPEEEISTARLRFVLQHELAHFKRRDLWYKLLLLTVCCLHWFNPLVWLLARRAEAAMEQACDAYVLALDGASRRDYGMSILTFAHPKAMRPLPLTTCFFGGKRQMLRRFEEIADATVKRRGLPLVALLAVAALISGSLIGCGTVIASTYTTVVYAETANVVSAASASESTATATQAEYRVQVTAIAAESAEITDAQPVEGPAAQSEEVVEEYAVAAAPSASGAAELEHAFLQDVEANRARAAELQAELDAVYAQLKSEAPEYSQGEMRWPLPGFYYISSAYGSRFGGNDFHTGMDIAGPGDLYGAPVTAAKDGTVLFINTEYTQGLGYGIYMLIDHGDEITTLYAQLSAVTVQVGDSVQAGQQIGKVGSTGFSTGPHLHFEVRAGSKHVDPAPYFQPAADTAAAPSAVSGTQE